jgi:hypothetical protein
MRTRLSPVKMKAEDDPRILFNQLATIQSAYNDATRKIDPDDLIAVVLEKAPEKYKSILTAEQRHKGTGLTLSDLNSCMNDLLRTMYPNTKAVTKAETKFLWLRPVLNSKVIAIIARNQVPTPFNACHHTKLGKPWDVSRLLHLTLSRVYNTYRPSQWKNPNFCFITTWR